MKRRNLTHDERAIWKRATKDVRRLPADGRDAENMAQGPAGLKIGETTREAAFPVRAPTGSAETKRAARGSAFEGGDPALDRRARRGRIRPERRLDLHGLREAPARVALTSFLERAQAEGCRCVLVITGKGARETENDVLSARPRGVIRRRFKDWIDEPPLRSIVARAAPAAPRDGGAGAFYVFLKGKRPRL